MVAALVAFLALPKPEFHPTKGSRNTIVYADSRTGKEVVVYDLTGDWDANYNLVPEIVRVTQTGNYFVGIKTIGNNTIPREGKTIQGEIDGNLIHCAMVSSIGSFHTSTSKITRDGDVFECIQTRFRRRR
jgi:hypothetical protein